MLAAPFAAHILSQLGAEIIKVEPPTGDPTRSLVRGGPSGTFIAYSHGKKSVCIDLSKPEGHAAFCEAAEDRRCAGAQPLAQGGAQAQAHARGLRGGQSAADLLPHSRLWRRPAARRTRVESGGGGLHGSHGSQPRQWAAEPLGSFLPRSVRRRVRGDRNARLDAATAGRQASPRPSKWDSTRRGFMSPRETWSACN